MIWIQRRFGAALASSPIGNLGSRTISLEVTRPTASASQPLSCRSAPRLRRTLRPLRALAAAISGSVIWKTGGLLARVSNRICGTITALPDGRSADDFEMRFGWAHSRAVDRDHVLRAGRKSDDAIHLGAQGDV